MTESEWLSCSDPWDLVKFVERSQSSRKLNLYAIACCRRASDLINDPRHSRALTTAEFMAEGPLTAAKLAEFADAFQPVIEMWAEEKRKLRRFGQKWRTSHYISIAILHLRGRQASDHVPRYAAKDVARYAAKGLASQGAQVRDSILDAEMAVQCEFIRDIFGNPFHPIIIKPDWFTPDVIMLARVAYDRRAFDRLPILGDALEEAGCTDVAILSHCRETIEHVRGCWVVDALLGRE